MDNFPADMVPTLTSFVRVARIIAIVTGAVLRGFAIVAEVLGVLLVLPRIFDAKTLARDPHGGAFMTIGGIVLLLLAGALWIVGKLLGLAGSQPSSQHRTDAN